MQARLGAQMGGAVIQSMASPGVEAIVGLAADPARRSDMGARGRQKAEAEFDDRVVIERTLDAYRSLPEPPTSWTTARMRS